MREEMEEKRVLRLKRRMEEKREEKRVLLLKRRMQEKREEMKVLLLKRMLEKRVLVMRQPMEEGMMRANRRAVTLAKAMTPQEKMPEERATVLLEKRDRARNRRSHRQR